MREYVVSLVKGVNYDQVWADIENPTAGLPHIPDRPVSIANNRDAMDRLCHYSLTDEEAAALKNDPRVLDVEIPIEHRPEVVVKLNASQTGDFTKPKYNAHSGTNINWGLLRHSNTRNVYGTSDRSTGAYNYTATGLGVDIVIADSGIQYDHDEFAGRVELYNWTGSLDTTPNSDDFRDDEGHGTHVAAIAAGKTFGWAKNAKIYPIKAFGAGAIPDTSLLFDYIKTWHTSKTNGRPTVVNCSFGFAVSWERLGITHINYRGSNVSATSPDTTKGMLSTVGGSPEYGALLYLPQPPDAPVNSESINVAVEELIDAGVTVCISSGNNGYKIDVPGGLDYNNHVVFDSYDGTPLTPEIGYYHRGTSPIHANAIVVGALAYKAHSAALDKKAPFSAAGPGVDIYAAGEGIRSAYITTDIENSAPYSRNSSYRQATEQGTSQASPQVAGMCALYLQANPTATPAQVKQWLLSNATNTVYSTGLDTDYTDPSSILGGVARVAYANVTISTAAPVPPSPVPTPPPPPVAPPTAASPVISIAYSGRTSRIIVPAGVDSPATIYLWGAGGGAGGKDTYAGGAGAAGQCIKIVMPVSPGDILDISPGGAGSGGLNSKRSGAGGAAGTGYIDVSGNRYGGGTGGSSGGSGVSGSGGGGGGATVLALVSANTSIRHTVAVAGGGGGGGGGGDNGAGYAAYANSAVVSSSTVGGNGQNMSGDGGGGGGGGGGYYAGNGGASADSDTGGYGGVTGTSWANTSIVTSAVVYEGNGPTPRVVDTYDVGSYATGGATTRVASGNGYAVIEFLIKPLPYVKNYSTWVPVEQAWIKVSNAWYEIDKIYVKRDGVWRAVSQADAIAVNTLATNEEHGAGGTRSY